MRLSIAFSKLQPFPVKMLLDAFDEVVISEWAARIGATA